MTTKYDPFAAYDPNRETHQRLNQVASQTGQPAIPDFSLIDQMAKNANSVRQTQHPDMRRLAASSVDSNRLYGNYEDPSRVIHVDDAGPPYILLGCDPRFRISVHTKSVEQVVAESLSERYRICDVSAVVGCQTNSASCVLIVGYGEYICLYKCCAVCRAWFGDPERKWSKSINFTLPDFNTSHVAD